MKIHWRCEDQEGVLPLRGGALSAVLAGGLLDRINRAPGEQEDGFTARLSEGRVELAASGRLVFLVGGKSGRKAILPAGGALDFVVGELRGALRLRGGEDLGDPAVGREVAGYRLLGRLGSGAVGVVYRALQTSLDREIALKVLNAEAARDPAKVASFRREAIAAGRLSHPNLVQVHDVGDDGDWHFYSMELVPGGNLEDLLEEVGPRPWQEAAAALRDAARGLAFAESHHLVHRDVKPENLMRTASGHVKLADLGLATTRGLIDREGAGGTPHFMAPECVRPEGADHRSDLYSLGCTLYRLLTGDTPFHGATVRDILRAHREQPAPTLKGAGVEVPRELEELLAELLAKDPLRRPPHASEVADRLERILAQPHPRRGRGLATLIVAAAAVAAGIRWLGGGGEPDLANGFGPDAEAERLAEERLTEQELQRSFTQAMGRTDPAQRAAALQEFLAAHPAHPLAATARQELQRLAAAPAVNGEATPGEDPTAAGAPPSAEFQALAAQVDEALGSGRFGAALAALAAAPPEFAAAATELRARAVAAAEARIAAAEAEHARLLATHEIAAATALLGDLATSLAGASGAETAAWSARLAALRDATTAATEAAAAVAFTADRLALIEALHTELRPALARFDLAYAAAAYDRAREALAHPGLSAAAAAPSQLLGAAARAEQTLRAHLRAAGPLAITEPIDGKRALLLDLAADGPLVEVQVRGERVQRQDRWDAYLTGAVLPGFLNETMPAEADPADLLALQLALAAGAASSELRALAAAPAPGPARDLAAACRAWLALARPLPEPPAWLEGERAALRHVAEFAAALAANDDFGALLRIEDFLAGFSLCGALASDGSAAWGLSP